MNQKRTKGRGSFGNKPFDEEVFLKTVLLPNEEFKSFPEMIPEKLSAFFKKTPTPLGYAFHICLVNHFIQNTPKVNAAILKSLPEETRFLDAQPFNNQNQFRFSFIRKLRNAGWFLNENSPVFQAGEVFSFDEKTQKVKKWLICPLSQPPTKQEPEEFPLPFSPANQDKVFLVSVDNELRLIWQNKEKISFYSFDTAQALFVKMEAEQMGTIPFSGSEESQTVVASDSHAFAIVEVSKPEKEMKIWWFSPKKTSSMISQALSLKITEDFFPKVNKSFKKKPFSAVLNSQESQLVVYQSTSKKASFIRVNLEKGEVIEKSSASLGLKCNPVKWFNFGEETICVSHEKNRKRIAIRSNKVLLETASIDHGFALDDILVWLEGKSNGIFLPENEKYFREVLGKLDESEKEELGYLIKVIRIKEAGESIVQIVYSLLENQGSSF